MDISLDHRAPSAGLRPQCGDGHCTDAPLQEQNPGGAIIAVGLFIPIMTLCCADGQPV